MDELELECVSGDNMSLAVTDLDVDSDGPRVEVAVETGDIRDYVVLNFDDVLELRNWTTQWIEKYDNRPEELRSHESGQKEAENIKRFEDIERIGLEMARESVHELSQLMNSDDPYDQISDLPLLERAQFMSDRPSKFNFEIGHYWNLVEELTEYIQTVEAERDFFDKERAKVVLREEALLSHIREVELKLSRDREAMDVIRQGAEVLRSGHTPDTKSEVERLRSIIDRALDMAGNRWSEWGSRAESVVEILEEA